MKNIKHIILVALAVLALGLASLGAIAPSVSGEQKIVETSATAYVAADTRGEMPGATAPRITVDGGLSGGVVAGH
ncbi:MAG: hypothetical protein ACJ8CR_19100 [Roseiflexaceae bacterium]